MEEKNAPERRSYDASGRRAAAERRRLHVAEVAARLFAERGWNGTTLALVAAESGVSVELVTKTFDGKAGLFMEAFRSAGFGRRGGLREAFAGLRLDDEPDLEVTARPVRRVRLQHRRIPMGPLVLVLAPTVPSRTRPCATSSAARTSATRRCAATWCGCSRAGSRRRTRSTRSTC